MISQAVAKWVSLPPTGGLASLGFGASPGGRAEEIPLAFLPVGLPSTRCDPFLLILTISSAPAKGPSLGPFGIRGESFFGIRCF